MKSKGIFLVGFGLLCFLVAFLSFAGDLSGNPQPPQVGAATWVTVELQGDLPSRLEGVRVVDIGLSMLKIKLADGSWVAYPLTRVLSIKWQDGN